MLRRGEDTHERAAHISLAHFSLRPANWAVGSLPPIRLLAWWETRTAEAFRFHPKMHPWGLRNHPHISKSPLPGNRLWDEGVERSETQAHKSFLFSNPSSLVNGVFWGKHKHHGREEESRWLSEIHFLEYERRDHLKKLHAVAMAKTVLIKQQYNFPNCFYNFKQ